MNFNKEGYSTDEVAQILHCCKATETYPGLHEEPSEQVPKRGPRRMEGFRGKETAEAHSLDELTGAWAGLAEQNKQEISRLEEALNSAPIAVTPAEHPSFSISIDVRIAVGNIESGTASKIIDALLQDNNISYNEITIKKGVCYK